MNSNTWFGTRSTRTWAGFLSLKGQKFVILIWGSGKRGRERCENVQHKHKDVLCITY